MAKRNSSKRTNLYPTVEEKYEYDEEPILEETENPSYNDRVKLKLIIGVKSFSIDGPVSGEHYKWTGAGSVLDVLQEDVAGLLAKRIGSRTCCGDKDSNRILELVKE